MSKRGERAVERERDVKICTLTNSWEQIDVEILKPLVKDSRYICHTCGRSAADAERLCSPEIM
jgi:hypothetical protein